ncbi:MAG: hypothetical protein ACRDLT_16370, partial [Solirubrobacteraceae bacterium]
GALGARAPGAGALGARAPGAGALGAGAPGAGWRRGRRRTLAVLSACGLVLAASATAAVLIATASRPLAGRLPAELLGKRYALRVTPDLRAGHAGWCVSLLDIDASEAVVPVPAECVSGEGPLIARGGLAVISPKTGTERGRLLYAIVDRRVAFLRAPGGARILPISSRQLPSGWRAAVTIQSHPAAGSGGSPVELTPLGAGGRPLDQRDHVTAGAPTRTVSASHPPAAGCRLRVRTSSWVRLGQERVVAGPLPRSATAVRFLACSSLSLETGGSVSVVTLLVDAGRPGDPVGPARPGRPVGSIPGLAPLQGHSGTWIGEARAGGGADTGLLERLFVRRAGHAWLVLETPASPTLALALLRHISAAT